MVWAGRAVPKQQRGWEQHEGSDAEVSWTETKSQLGHSPGRDSSSAATPMVKVSFVSTNALKFSSLMQHRQLLSLYCQFLQLHVDFPFTPSPLALPRSIPSSHGSGR